MYILLFFEILLFRLKTKEIEAIERRKLTLDKYYIFTLEESYKADKLVIYSYYSSLVKEYLKIRYRKTSCTCICTRILPIV